METIKQKKARIVREVIAARDKVNPPKIGNGAIIIASFLTGFLGGSS